MLEKGSRRRILGVDFVTGGTLFGSAEGTETAVPADLPSGMAVWERMRPERPDFETSVAAQVAEGMMSWSRWKS